MYVIGFLPTFTLAGGINLPKIITCIGSDGEQRRQLVKVCLVLFQCFLFFSTLSLLVW